MDAKEFKAARHKLGLTLLQTAQIMGVDARTVRKWEAGGDAATARAPNPIAVKVLGWLQSGELKLTDPPKRGREGLDGQE